MKCSVLSIYERLYFYRYANLYTYALLMCMLPPSSYQLAKISSFSHVHMSLFFLIKVEALFAVQLKRPLFTIFKMEPP